MKIRLRGKWLISIIVIISVAIFLAHFEGKPHPVNPDFLVDTRSVTKKFGEPVVQISKDQKYLRIIWGKMRPGTITYDPQSISVLSYSLATHQSTVDHPGKVDLPTSEWSTFGPETSLNDDSNFKRVKIAIPFPTWAPSISAPLKPGLALGIGWTGLVTTGFTSADGHSRKLFRQFVIGDTSDSKFLASGVGVDESNEFVFVMPIWSDRGYLFDLRKAGR